MRRLLFTIVVCTIILTGCAVDTSKIPIIGNKSTENNDATDYPIEYDADGNVIPVEITDPDTGETYMIDPILGFRIDESIDGEVMSEDDIFASQIGITYSDLLSQRVSYPQLTVTLYGANGNPRIVDQYVYDDFNNTAVRYEYDSYNSVSMTYFDNKTNKAYTNLGMRGWQEISNERLESLQVLINPDGFEQSEFYQSGDYIYLKGMLPMQNVGTGRDIISRLIINNFKSLSDINLEGIYRASDNSLLRLELHIINNDGEYLLSAVPSMNRQSVIVPENVLYRESTIIQEVSTEMKRIPAYAYVKPIVYGNATEVDREVVLRTYNFKRTDIVDKYGDSLDINAYLERLGTILEDDMSVIDFVENINSGIYTDDVDKAASGTIYEYLLNRDSEMSEEDIAALRLKDEPIEYPIEYDENGNLILIESVDENGNTIWINPETGEYVNEDGSPIVVEEQEEETEEEQEPEEDSYTMYATTTVNVRKGPGTGFDKVGSITAGTAVTVIGVDENDTSWLHIILGDDTFGYIKSDYLRK